MTEVAVEVDTSLLEALDFKPRCEHSKHNDPMVQRLHSGDAEYLVRAFHNCTTGDPPPTDYLACAKWAAHVISMADEWWFCPSCGEVSVGSNMAIVLGPIDSS